jgi:two-component system sensor histidine kinase AlgZ
VELLNKDAMRQWVRSAARQLDHDTVFSRADAEGEILPNFCEGRTILSVVIVAQMLAILITLVTRRISLNVFQDLLLISLFVQWIGLASAGVLCASRRYLNRLSNLRAFGVAYLLLLCVTWLVSESAVWLLFGFGKINTPRPEWYNYFHVQNICVSAIVNALVLHYFFAKHELRVRTLSAARIKAQAMLSRIRPQFVFSGMNIIASLTRSDPAKAEAAIEDMADLFRMMLSQDETLVPVKNEIEVAQKYLAIEGLRLDNRLRVDWDIGKFPRKAVMPILTLQPLLENAIRHGIEPIAEGGVITVRLWEHEDKIYIKIINPTPRTRAKRAADNHSMSLEDIRLRFQSHYGDTAKLEFGREDEQYIVNVVLPVRKERM